MAQPSSAHGGMDIQDQKSTFSGFLSATVWGCTLAVQVIALLALAFAVNLGWWPALAALVVIGIAAGLVFRMSGVYWAVQIALWVLLGIGGLIVPALSGVMG